MESSIERGLSGRRCGGNQWRASWGQSNEEKEKNEREERYVRNILYDNQPKPWDAEKLCFGGGSKKEGVVFEYPRLFC